MGQGIPEERLKNESITAVQYREDFHDVNIHMIDDDFNMDELFFSVTLLKGELLEHGGFC